MTLQETLSICFDSGLLPKLLLVRGSKALEMQQWSHGTVNAGWAGTRVGFQAEETDVQLTAVTLQVMMKNACYSIGWSGLFRIRSNCICWNEYERIRTTLFLHVPRLDINSLILLLPRVRKMWFFAKLAKNFALELKTQLSGESKHEQ